MAAKVLVLVSNNDGPMEIIKNGEYGFYFQKEDINDCAKQILQIINTRKETKQIIENAYGHVCNLFSVSNTAKQYIQAYRSVTD